jgi:NAD(P)-dependent dehydrogenase (short-subunit alcohol dehydrogenase family)
VAVTESDRSPLARSQAWLTAAAAGRVQGEYGRLGVLAGNAGTAGPRVGTADLTAAEAMRGFGINVFGPIRVTRAFLPLLGASDHPRIVTVPGGAGSVTRIRTPGTAENAVTLPVCPAAKAALTMLTVRYARALDGILVNAAGPGFCRNRLQQQPRHPDGDRGHGRDRAPRHPAQGRPGRHLPGSPRHRPVVTRRARPAEPEGAERRLCPAIKPGP